MGLTDKEYSARKAAIDRDWPADAYSALNAHFVGQLDAQRQAPAPSQREPKGNSDVTELARQYAATMTYADALRRAEQVIAAERGQPLEVTAADIERMSIADLDAYIRGMDRTIVFPNEADSSEPVSAEQQAADVRAMWEQSKPSLVFGGASMAEIDARVQSGIEARNAAAKRDEAIETAFRDTKSRAPGLSDENARSMAEAFIGPLSAAHAQRLGESTSVPVLEDTPEFREWLGLRPKDA